MYHLESAEGRAAAQTRAQVKGEGLIISVFTDYTVIQVFLQEHPVYLHL